MLFEQIVLKFDIESIAGKEINNHIKYYMDRSDEGMRLLNEGKKEEQKKALGILKEINKYLDEEYKYFSKKAFHTYGLLDNDISGYVDSVTSAKVKQNNRNSYKALRSNLYDVWDYFHFEGEFEDDKRYGNIYRDKVLRYIDDIEPNSIMQPDELVLRAIDLFYQGPSKKSAKMIKEFWPSIKKLGYEDAVNVDYLKLYL